MPNEKTANNYQSFLEHAGLRREDFYRQAFLEDCKTIRIKKEKVATKNLEKIFEATFRICTRKGFQGMTMRDLSTESGLSMGALYSYFATKEELLNTLQRVGNSFVARVLDEAVAGMLEPRERLQTVLRAHLYLSEMMQPWFFFSYMEAKNLAKKEREAYVRAERHTEKIIEDILVDGEKTGLVSPRNHQMTASVIKAMIQDWYLKRGKYAKRGISVEEYTKTVIDWITGYCFQEE